jgi:hypothetical protein
VNKVSKNVKPSSKRKTPPIDPFRLKDGLLQLWHQKKPDDILHEVLSTMLYCAFPMHESDFKKVSSVGKEADVDPERNGIYIVEDTPGMVYAQHTKSDYGLVGEIDDVWLKP